MISTDDIYLLTYVGKRELAAAATSLSHSELELLVLIDGKTNVRELQERVNHLDSGTVIVLLDKLLRSDLIALRLIDLNVDEVPGQTRPIERTAAMPDASAIERGVSSLQQNGYIVRIARRQPPERKQALQDKHAVMAALDKKLTVLVVEDDADLARNMQTALTQADFVVRSAANREQVIAAFRQSPRPDLVLLDVMLPDGNGFAILSNMRQHPILVEVPVIMVTGAATREAVLRGLQEGADGYITKPFELGVLLKAVNTVLGIEVAERDTAPSNLWDQTR